MSKVHPKSLTAAQEILCGAMDLDEASSTEFTEWDLTIASWKRSPNRFGCRGYEDQHPDHKRVMMEIMGTTKKDNPIRRGWLEKTRPNTYRLTDLGRTEAGRLRQASESSVALHRSPQSVYDAIAPLYKSTVFRKHCKDKEEPRMWLGAASFFQLTKGDALHLEDRLRATESAIQDAIEWMDENATSHIQRGVSGGSETISRDSVLKLQKFYIDLLDRFSNQISAIRKSSK